MKDDIRILHIDDDEEDFIIIQDLLNDISDQSYTIEWVSSYSEAQQKIKSNDYDIFLVDFRLGNYSGIELLKFIRQHNYFTPVIIFTGQGDEMVDIEAMKAGAADYLIKGQIDANMLERSIRYSVSQAGIQRQLVEKEQYMRNSEKFAVTGRVAQVIAHEIRNPLTNVKLALQQLEDEISNPNESVKSFIQLIDRNCNRINQLITNLLDSTKFSELKFEDVSINDILDETIELAIDRIELKHIQIVKQYDPAICDVFVDREKIKIALLNIIINAIEEVSESRGIITFKTEGKEEKCIVTIHDNGNGIDPEIENRIFEPYFSKKQKGIGLGLTNTQNIILNHKGTIKVQSQTGKGTTFTITFDFSPNGKKSV